MSDAPRRCPARTGARPVDPPAAMPSEGPERAVMLALRFVAAAGDTGDAACFDAALDGAEAAFGPRDGALLVARAAALVRGFRREAADIRFLPPPCRFLSSGEANLLGALRLQLRGRRATADGLSGAMRAALSDLMTPLLPRRRPAALPTLSPAATASVAHTAVECRSDLQFGPFLICRSPSFHPF